MKFIVIPPAVFVIRKVWKMCGWKSLFATVARQKLSAGRTIRHGLAGLDTNRYLSIKALTNFDSDSKNRITFTVTGQPELRALLGYSHFDSLRVRIRLSYHISPMDLEETLSYIDHGLEVVHRSEKLFSDAASRGNFSWQGPEERLVENLKIQYISKRWTLKF